MKLSHTWIARRWRAYVGPKDERLEAEAGRIYRTGYCLLTGGMLTIFIYRAMESQVAFVHGITNTTGYASILADPMFLLLFATSVLCATMQTRKGFVETNRFAQTETFPFGYFALISALAGLAVSVAIGTMRCAIEIQIVAANEVFWVANFAVGAVFGIAVFGACLGLFALQFRDAKRHRERIERSLDD